MANPFPFVANTVLTAAQLNGIGEAWTSYTPVLKGGATTVTATISYAKYAQINKLVIVSVGLVATSAGAASGAISVSLPIVPVVPGTNFRSAGTFFVLDSGVAQYFGSANLNPATQTVVGIAYGGTDSMGVSTPTMTLATNDQIVFTCIYEVA